MLHVLQTIGVGGTEKRAFRLRRGLDESIYDVRVLSLRPALGPTVNWPEDEHTLFPIASGLHLNRLLRLASVLRKGHYHIVHSHNWSTMLYGVLAARLAGVRVVLHGEHGPNWSDWKGVTWKREAAAALLARLVTRVVAVNEFIGRDLTSRWRLNPSHVVCIPNGVDLVRFAPAPRSPRDRAMLIGTVARFDPIKNLPCMIRAFDMFKKANPAFDARLVLVGDGPIREDIRLLAKSMDSAQFIELPGETPKPEEWYPRFDVYVNSSFSEGMNNTILEAMACGLPIVASSVPGNRCWLEDGVNTLFFESDNSYELSQRLTSLAGDLSLRRRLGEENRRRVERSYDSREFIARYHRLYQEVLKRI